MSTRPNTIGLLLLLASAPILAKDAYPVVINSISPQIFSNSLVTNPSNTNWINTKSNLIDNPYTDEDQFTFAWGLSDLLTVNFDIYENKFIENKPSLSSNQFQNTNDFNSDSINRSAIGYKIGLSSKLGLGNNYKLGINLDYGLMNDAGIAGFNTADVNTTSLELGIRKKKFGASINTNIYMDERVDFMENSQVGFELDWHFSENTIFSFGTKQTLNDSSIVSNPIDNLTGNVKYIKFQHNL